MSFRLPLRTTDFDAGIAGLLHAALNGAPRRDLLDSLCRQLATVLRLRLALLAQRADSGSVTVEAASAENGLWLELQRIPERWDGGISSQGPAGRVLRSNAVAQMRTGDEGFGLWRASADAEHVREILALPIAAEGHPRVLELYFGNDIAPACFTCGAIRSQRGKEEIPRSARNDTGSRNDRMPRSRNSARLSVARLSVARLTCTSRRPEPAV